MDEMQAYLIEQKKKKGYLFVPYHAFCDPDAETSLEIVRTLFKAGADSIEIGLPFSDPVADGPVLQRTFRRILKQNYDMKIFMNFLEKIANEFPEKKLLVMGYANLFIQYGIRKIFQDLYDRNVRGVIIPDVPADEKLYLTAENNLYEFQNKIAWIDFVTPASKPERIESICEEAAGFIYLVSYKGVTGKAGFDLAPLKPIIKKIRSLTKTPILVGFGVRTAEHVKQTVQSTDGFIIASRLHEIIEDNIDSVKKIPGLIEKEVKSLLV